MLRVNNDIQIVYPKKVNINAEIYLERLNCDLMINLPTESMIIAFDKVTSYFGAVYQLKCNFAGESLIALIGVYIKDAMVYYVVNMLGVTDIMLETINCTRHDLLHKSLDMLCLDLQLKNDIGLECVPVSTSDSYALI